MIACVVSPFDQRLPVAADEVKTTLPPSQNVSDPVTVTIGLVGISTTVVVTGSDGREVQPPPVTVTV